MDSNSLEPPRKRLRKGTRSCIECKRRKIKCVFVSETDNICAGCLGRGTACLSQDDPAVIAIEERTATDGAIHDRLTRVEALLLKVVEKLELKKEDEDHDHIPEEVFDAITPSSSLRPALNGNAPVLRLFDQAVFGYHDLEPGEQFHTHLLSSAQTKNDVKLDKLRSKLVPALPLQQDVDTIVRESKGWYIVLSCHIEAKGEGNGLTGSYTIKSLATAHPVLLARSFIAIAMALQQLPASFPRNLLRQLHNVEEYREKYMTLVKCVTGDDDLMTTFEGLTCLLLEAVFYINAGKPRTTWLIFRRAINLAQLVGFHRNTKQMRLDAPDEEIPVEAADQLWRSIVQAEAFLAVLLGLPSAVSPNLCERTIDIHQAAPPSDITFYQRLMFIANKIIDRDQTGSKSYSTTQSIDEDIERLKVDMPRNWWTIPAEEQIAYPLPIRFQESFNRMYSQMWFYNMEALLHLPFMLRSGTESRYQYSQFACLQASREVIRRYLYIRCTNLICCTIMEFQAFTAAVTILLKLLCPQHGALESAEKEEDWDIVKKLIKAFERLVISYPDAMIRQCLKVLKTLIAVGRGENEGTENGIKLVIPYFGTLLINRTRKECEMANKQNEQSEVYDNGTSSCDQFQDPQLGIPTPPYVVANVSGSQIQFTDAPLICQDMQAEPLLEGWFYDMDGNSCFQNFFF